MTGKKDPIALANAEIMRVIERGKRRAAQKFERMEDKARTRRQKARYQSGAADSPTPPPRKSVPRDRQLVDILGFIEPRCLDTSGRIRVSVLTELFLFEQGRIPDRNKPRGALTSDDLAMQMMRETDAKQRSKLAARIKFRQSKGLKGVRVYGWDRHTDLAKAPFHAWAMDPLNSRPFTVLFSKEVLEGAEASKREPHSHLQDRLSRLLRLRFGGQTLDFWFILEAGSSTGVHVHGAIAWPTDALGQSRVREALKKWSGSEARTAVNIGMFTNQGTWAIYPQKFGTWTAFVVGSKTLSSTRAVKAGAKDLFKQFHAEYRARSRT